MLDIKWKNSKYSFPAALVVGMAAAAVFFALFPFFNRKAAESYVNPLTQQDFLRELMTANYVQYKYLREKTDLQEYDYCDLYLDYEITTRSLEELSIEELETYYMDFESNYSLQSLKSRIHDDFCSQFDNHETFLADLGARMDYHVEHLETGTILSNSGSSLPEAVRSDQKSDDKSSEEEGADRLHDYVYYVSLDYDRAGNVTNVYVRCNDNAKQFLNRIQTIGHEKMLELPTVDSNYRESGGRSSVYYLLEEEQDQCSSVRISLSFPANMRVMYGITSQQYTQLSTEKDETYYFSTMYRTRLQYYDSGVGLGYCILLLGCLICGVLTGLQYRKSSSSPEHIQQGRSMLWDPWIEVLVLAVVFIYSTAGSVITYVYEYENGLFLRNIRAGLGIDKIVFIHLDQAAMFLMLTALFLSAALIGQGFSDIRRDNLKDRSFICRYWRKICQKVKEICFRFYTELVSYDIGTDAKRIIIKVLVVNFMILLVICSFWFAGIFGLIVYSVVIYFILKRYVMDIQEKYRRLLHATRSIAQGNLDTALYEDFGIFESYKSQLRQIQMDFKKAVHEEVKSQRMKSELITNVSHDLKTPLTAIITYIDLLKEPGVSEEKREEYLDILQKKANRLKILIEDLFEISKASSKTVALQIVDVDICNLIRQAYLEQEDRVEAAHLDFKFTLPGERILLPLDSQKTYRIFDNLYTNIIKYALTGTRVYVTVRDNAESVEVEMKNISAAELTMDPGELTERFVRGDDSRNTEGSGLGLAIAKSFAELQGGSMQLSFDGDLFKCLLTFRKDASKKREQKFDPKDPFPSSTEVERNGNRQEGYDRSEKAVKDEFPGRPMNPGFWENGQNPYGQSMDSHSTPPYYGSSYNEYDSYTQAGSYGNQPYGNNWGYEYPPYESQAYRNQSYDSQFFKNQSYGNQGYSGQAPMYGIHNIRNDRRFWKGKNQRGAQPSTENVSTPSNDREKSRKKGLWGNRNSSSKNRREGS